MKMWWLIFLRMSSYVLESCDLSDSGELQNFPRFFRTKSISISRQDDRQNNSAICGDTDRHAILFEFTTLCYHRNQTVCSWAMHNAWFERRTSISLEVSRQTQQFQQTQANNYEKWFTTVCFIYDNDHLLERASDQEVLSMCIHSSPNTELNSTWSFHLNSDPMQAYQFENLVVQAISVPRGPPFQNWTGKTCLDQERETDLVSSSKLAIYLRSPIPLKIRLVQPNGNLSVSSHFPFIPSVP
jgi:hypothetical protein